MTCDDIEKKLSAYLDDELTPENRDEVSRHLETCSDCRRELSELKAMVNLLEDLPEVEPPPFFEQRIMAHIREDAKSSKSFLQRFFFPLHIKIPIQALATVLVAVLAFYVYRGGNPEIKRIAPLPVPTTESRQAETVPPTPSIGTVKKTPVPEMRKKDAGSKQTPSFAPPPPAQSVTPSFKDEAVSPVVPGRQEAPRLPSVESALPAIVQKEQMRESEDRNIDKGAAMAPSRRLEKTSDAIALNAEKKERDTAPAASMKALRSSAPAPSVSAGPSGRAQGVPLPDITLHVLDLDQTFEEIKKRTQEIEGHIVERQQKDGKYLLKIEIDARHAPDLLNQLQNMGVAVRHHKRLVQTDAKTIVSVELIENP